MDLPRLTPEELFRDNFSGTSQYGILFPYGYYPLLKTIEAAMEALTPERLRAKYEAADDHLDGTLLKGLDTIDWSLLNHAHGSASDVPALLRATLSPDEDDRDFAFQLLHETIWHQGTIYQATSYVVPFLVHLLTWDETPDKASILGLLGAIATGSPRVSEESTWQKEWYAQKGRDFKAAVAAAAADVRAARDAVRRGLYRYVELMDHPQPDVRQAVNALVVTLPEAADRIVPLMNKQIMREPDSTVKAKAIDHVAAYLSSLAPSTTPTRSDFIRLFGLLVDSDDEPMMVRFAAAVALARLTPTPLADRPVQVILAAIAHPQGVDPDSPHDLRPLSQFVYEKIVVKTAVSVLAQLDLSRSVPLLMKALIRATTPEHAHIIAVILLSLALLGERFDVSYRGESVFENDTLYYASTYPRAADGVEERRYPIVVRQLAVENLTHEQRQAVSAVVENPQVWNMRSNLLEVYGLPSSRVEVRQLLAGGTVAGEP